MRDVHSLSDGGNVHIRMLSDGGNVHIRMPAQAAMLEATRESTEALQAVADLRQRQAKLERSMSAGGDVGAVADDGPLARREAEERARLIQLVRLQAKVRACAHGCL